MSQLSRRALLRSASAAAVAAVGLPALNLVATAAQVLIQRPRSRNAGFYQFTLGSFEMISVSDGVLSVPASVFAGNAPADQFAEVLRQGFESETLTPDCNVLYVNTGQNKVLIDTGSGTAMGATAGKLLENLQAAGITPAEIDSVILTHAHGDHVGGLLDASGNPIFANAQFYISRAEYEFWMQPQVSLPKIGVSAEMQQGMISTAKKQLSGIQNRLTQFEVNQPILPGFTAIEAFGHTPGQVAIRITSGDTSLIHIADVVHTRHINLWHPEWQPIFDADPDQAVETRKRILQQVSDSRE